MAWVPLEANPEVMTKFLHRLGVPEKWGLVDVYGLDPELLDMMPKPVLAFILLYPINPKLEAYKLELETGEREKGASNEDVYHLMQYVPNACGTVALIHSVANNLDQIELLDGYMRDFINETKDLSSEERGHKLINSEGISHNHEEVAQEGQTQAPSEDEKIFFHFVAFVQKNGSIYELDGRKPYAINHGPSNSKTFMVDASRVCQEYMKRDPNEVHFTLIALAAQEN